MDHSQFILKRDIIKSKFILGELYFLIISFTIILWISYLWLNDYLLLIGFISCQIGITFSFLYLIKKEKVRISNIKTILSEITNEFLKEEDEKIMIEPPLVKLVRKKRKGVSESGFTKIITKKLTKSERMKNNLTEELEEERKKTEKELGKEKNNELD